MVYRKIRQENNFSWQNDSILIFVKKKSDYGNNENAFMDYFSSNKHIS